MIIDSVQIKPYLKAGSDLLPLHTWNKKIKGKERGKSPIHNEWTSKEYTHDQIKSRSKAGHNIGYRIGEFDLVIDLDPRNYKDVDIIEKICNLFDVFDFEEITEQYPTVSTGRGDGGYHIYTRLPNDADYTLLKEHLDDYPGVEFKHKGKQVVAAGSKHPEGGFYTWVDVKSIHLKTTPKTPQSILNIIKRKKVKHNYTPGAGSLNGDQLRDLFLDKLDVNDFDDNDSWFPILCAAHHVTGGEGVDEFIDWCLDDFDYDQDEHTIRNRWESLNNEKEVAFTVGTLIRELEKLGEDTSGAKAILDFSQSGALDFNDDDHQDEEEKDIIDSVIDSDYEIDLEDVYQVDKKDHAGEPGAALEFARKLNGASDDEEIEKAVRLMKVAGEVEAARTMALIVSTTKIPKSVLKDIMKRSDEQITQDLSRLLTESTLTNIFNHGKHIMTLPSGSVYYYAKTHWKKISEDYLGKILMINLDKMKKKIKITVSETALVMQSLKNLRWCSAHNTDKLHRTGTPKAIINCQNGELWINDDGSHQLRAHNYKSAQLQVLGVDYNPEAECPLFMETINDIFFNYKDTDDLVDHMAEIMGYMIQPNKNMANWWLFKGPGGDGKSTLIHILGGILGDSQLKTTKKILSALTDDNGNDHAIDQLVGKLNVAIEELPAKYLVKDASLKLLSESTRMTANPKHEKSFPFTYCAGLIMCSNRFPSSSDLSYGMRRRANIIPFNRRFTDNGGDDIDRVKKILTNKKEMAGILNWMLAGLQRLRSRGNFNMPLSCQLITDEWIGVSNPVSRFVQESIQKVDMKHGVLLSDLHREYHLWCNANDLKPKAKMTVVQDLEDLGFLYGPGGGNTRRIYGAELIDNGCDDFDDI